MRWWMVASAAGILILLLIPWRERRPARVELEPAVAEPGDGPSEPEGPQPEAPAQRGAEPDPDPRPAEALEPSEGREPSARGKGPAVNTPSVAEPVPDIPPPETAGPLDVLRASYEADGPAADAAQVERSIRDLFGTPELPLDALRRIDCRRRVCRIEIWWSERQPLVYMALGMPLVGLQTPHVAVEPGPDRNTDGELPVTVYVLRAGNELDELTDTDEAPVTPPDPAGGVDTSDGL